MMWICWWGGTQGDNFLQEANEVLTGVASGGLAVNAAGGGFQGCIQGESSVPIVFKTVTLGAAR
jgi:hypothetical protein